MRIRNRLVGLLMGVLSLGAVVAMFPSGSAAAGRGQDAPVATSAGRPSGDKVCDTAKKLAAAHLKVVGKYLSASQKTQYGPPSTGPRPRRATARSPVNCCKASSPNCAAFAATSSRRPWRPSYGLLRLGSSSWCARASPPATIMRGPPFGAAPSSSPEARLHRFAIGPVVGRSP